MAAHDPLDGERTEARPVGPGPLVVRARGSRRGLTATACLVSVLLVWSAEASAPQPPPSSGGPPQSEQAGSLTRDVEAESEQIAWVRLSGEPVVGILAGLGPFTAQARADRISERLEAIVRDRSVPDLNVTITDVESSSELRVGPHLLMVITQRDAQAAGVSRALVAAEYARRFESALRAERLRYAPATLARSGAYAAVATLALLAGLRLVSQLTRRLHRWIGRWRSQKLESLRVQQVEIVSADHLARAIDRVATAVHVLLVVVVLDVYLTYVLGLFPWTRAVSIRLADYVMAPIRALGSALVGYLPNLLFVVVIGVLVYSAIRLVGFLFAQVRAGRLVFASFPAEWADPTNKIVRVLLIAFGVVVAFPYLPASSSPAFAGVSVLMGLLLSLASSSSLSNAIAGLVLTYTGAFRLGDRVKVGDAFGDIVEQSLLATRIRTIKNEEVTIPNSLVLGSSVTNYSREARTRGLILHTSVTIGYDVPWRKVHELLLQAARATPGVLPDPSPFVWQTALNDFYVTYEINAYTDVPQEMAEIYAALHRNIQDSFYEGGVEIMSPHYTALRDGNTVAIPESFRPAGYRAPRFRVDRGKPTEE